MDTAVSPAPNDAGYRIEKSCTTINRAVDRGLIKAKLQRRGLARLRKTGTQELRLLAIAGGVNRKLTPTGR